jgi:hypothetical protein
VDVIRNCKPLDEQLRYSSRGFFRGGVSASAVLEFLEGFAASPRILQANPELLVDYVRTQNEHGELSNWTVAVTTGNSPRKFEVAGETFAQVKRTMINGGKTIPAGTDFQVGVLVSPNHEAIGLDPLAYARAYDETRAEFARRGKKPPQRPSGQALRRHRTPEEGLLLIYPVDQSSVEGAGEDAPPLIGYALSLPISETARATRYRVNETYLKELQRMVSGADNELEEDDDL